LAIGSTPVTPVVNGRPVALVKVRDEGVPSAGVTRVGEVANTTLPEPVVVAALIAVPLPCNIPVTVVLNVIAGVVVAVATVPANPFADTTDTEETLPVEGVVQVKVPAPSLSVSTWPVLP
jgi:hypothetical protein